MTSYDAYGRAVTDPIVLAAQARAVAETLHKRNDVVVRFKTDQTGFREDALTDEDRENPGHFKADKRVLTLNLDALVGDDKERPTSLASLEDFRKYPVLAGKIAHEAGHARWSRWNEALPESIPNPDFDPFEDDSSEPESFPVSGNGKLLDLAGILEEPRIERLGTAVFTKTWRRAMQLSAGHLILESVDEMEDAGQSPLDSAVRMAILVGGRITAGTLGATRQSRQSAKKVLESAQQIIEKSLPDQEDPYYSIMGIVNEEVFNNKHDDPVSHLEAARQILKIVHPEEADDPDGSGEGEGEGEEGPEGSEGEGDPEEMASAAKAMAKMSRQMQKAVDRLSHDMAEMVKSEEEQPEDTKPGGHGSILYKNPKAPQVARYEQPTAADRELYKRALEWMQRQIEPTVTESEVGQWLPVGGARLNVRSMVRDNLAGHRFTERHDWDRVSETVKPAPPVKVAIMLDGSGSMSHLARPSASIAWAAANAAADLPESRTVSVVYGNAAQMTQEPGHVPARQVAVSKTDGGTEEFIDAARIVEEALWLNEPVEEGEPSNVLIIIVSDLHYGGADTRTGEGQFEGFLRITKEWAEKGYKTVVVGTERDIIERMRGRYSVRIPEDAKQHFEIVEPTDLFR